MYNMADGTGQTLNECFDALRPAAALGLSVFSAELWKSCPDGWFSDEETGIAERPARLALEPFGPGFLWLFLCFSALLGRLPSGFSDGGGAFALASALLLVQLALSDGLYMILQDQWSLALGGLGLARLALSEGFSPELERRLSASLFVLLLWLISALAALSLKKCSPLGLGDAKLLAADALLIGREGLIFSASAAFLGAGVYAALIILVSKGGQRDRISFGPFVCLGIMLYLLSTSCM